MNEAEKTDPRFTTGLFNEVIEVLERHGYQRAENDHRALGATLADLLTLVETFEGKRR